MSILVCPSCKQKKPVLFELTGKVVVCRECGEMYPEFHERYGEVRFISDGDVGAGESHGPGEG